MPVNLINRLKKNELYKNILLLVSGNGLAQLIPLLLYPVIARLFDPDDFGILAFIVSIHSLLLILSTARFDFAIILPKEDTKAHSLFNTSLSTALGLALLIPLLVILTRGRTQGMVDHPNIIPWLCLLSITVFTTAFAQILNGWNTRKKLFRAIVFYTLTLNILTSSLKLVFGLFGTEDGLLISFVIAQALALILYAFYVKRYGSLPYVRFYRKADLQVAGNYLNFPKYNMPHALINTLSINLPVFLLTFYFSESTTGQFSVAVALLFRPVSVYASSVSQALSQKVVELRNNNEEIWPTIAKFLKRTFMVAIIPGILIAVFAPFIFKTALGERWLIAGRLCRLMVPWSVAVILGGSLAFIPNVFSKQLYALIVDIIYIVLRIAALSVGIFFVNEYLAIGLFSITGVMVIGYLLIWYYRILKQHDQSCRQKK